MQVLILGQAALTLSPGGVQALIPRQAVLVPSSWEGVQAVQVLFLRKTGVSVPAKEPQMLQQGMPLLTWKIHDILPGNKSCDQEGSY